ncbi:MFS transporter [Flavobacterium sp. GSP27]|uniref:MFS transporter n=1 Tax=unclassified Flavobacterium TaxID=196869 RepID=UPI000F849E13|nr:MULTISPECIES: MFS transporter [unclassified Flavobacterium]RTY85801.1 MFS transporter [Flavobacterium sp. RSP15]RTY95682.1 MFS transporter [Flavobacterium sp. GSN2]RTZ00343.1 MFS transporter [Flavobacterium sp. RSP49]RTZ08772.1 MFS transporter [Flavobacterium sp. GSP27]
MKKSTIKLAMYLNYFVFAILLNSVGIVILKAQKNYGVDEFQASVLEAYKDLPIAIVSFLIASFLPRIGYKKAMLIGLALVSAACVSMYYGNSFGTAKLLFATVGVSFALIKVSVYSLIGTITTNQHEHNSLMSSIEGVFMIGIALAYFLFPAFNSDANPDAWLNVYWLLAGISLLSFGFLFFTKFENKIEIPGVDLADDFKQMFKLFAKLLTIVFVISAFLFVMIEQGIMSWLPTFNNKVLHLPENISIMMASILAISLAVGRLVAGVITKRVNWIWVLSFCIVAAMLIVIFVLPKTVGLNVKEINSLSDIPLIGFAFPLVGLFIAPIYPLLNSVVLSALPKKLHSSMTGLIVVFSALGGTLGSRVIGYLFKNEGPENAFYYTLIPMSLLLVSFFILKKLTAKQ